MPWIDQINEDEATGELQEVYNKIKQQRGKLSNVMRIHSLNPDVMLKHMDLYLSIMFSNSELTRKQRELIAVVVSSSNNCSYCIHHHAEALNNYWKDEEMIHMIIKDFHLADLSEDIMIMLKYVEKLTRTPDAMKKQDVEILKRAGYSDTSILDINLVTSYFNFVNRIVLGLGVEYSQDEVKGYHY